MRAANPDLIYDVGLLDGADTAYYLFRGYRVVAIDANPLMIEAARARFANEIAVKRLTLVNVGISETAGKATFWISDKPQWSSFDRDAASRDGTGHRPISVPTVPFSKLLEEYGVPHYLKVDIEGSDKLCVDALKGGTLPKYISVESEEETGAILESLRDVGYRRFKLVDQYDWLPVRPRAARFCARLINSAAHGRLRAIGLSHIAQKFTDQARMAALGFSFSPGCSGPWGDDVPGGWMTLNQAKSLYLRNRRSLSSREQPLYFFWYDWHATY
jgi:FkbM family methyltransferase